MAGLLARPGAIADGRDGQQLFEPPNVGGWTPGAAWFSTGTMLARANFAATLASSQKDFLATSFASESGTPQAF